MFWAPSASVDAAGTSALAATTGRAFLLLLGLLCQDRCGGGNVQMCSPLDLVTVWTVSALMMFPRGGHLQGKAASECAWLPLAHLWLHHPPVYLLASSADRGAKLGHFFHQGVRDPQV